MQIKQVTTYTYQGKASFDEDYILENRDRDLTKDEDTLVKFLPLFDETYVQDVGRFTVAKLIFKERKPVDEDVLYDVTMQRLPDGYTEDEYEAKAEDVRRELLQYTGFKNPKTPLVIIDNETKLLLVTESHKVADEVMSQVLSALAGDYSDLMTVSYDAPVIEKMLTDYLLDDVRNIPDPFMLGEKVMLGTKSEFDKSPKSATITIKKEYPADSQCKAFVTEKNKVVKLTQLEYDGVCEFDLTNKFEIKAIKFKEGLDFKPEEDTTDSANFMSQYYLQLPTLFDIITSIRQQLEEVKV